MEYLAGGHRRRRAALPSGRPARGRRALAERGRLGARPRPRAGHRAPGHQAGQLPARPRPRPARGRLRDRPACRARTRSPAPASCSAPPPTWRPSRRWASEATGASDRYALAVAAFELLTGGRPFTAPHFAAQARQHIEDEPPRASEREPHPAPGGRRRPGPRDGQGARGALSDRPGVRRGARRGPGQPADCGHGASPPHRPPPTRRRRGAAAPAGGAAAGGALAGAAAADAAQAGTPRPVPPAGGRPAPSPPRRSPRHLPLAARAGAAPAAAAGRSRWRRWPSSSSA